MGDFSRDEQVGRSSIHPSPNSLCRTQKASTDMSTASTEHAACCDGTLWERYHVESMGELFPQESAIGERREINVAKSLEISTHKLGHTTLSR
jgi:hypothetical protein